MGLRGFEPLTSPLSGVRSNQLSYRPTFRTQAGHKAAGGVSQLRRTALLRVLSPVMKGHEDDGMFFGEIAVLYSVKVTATVRTVSYCDLLSLSKEALSDAMHDYPKAAQIVSQKAAERTKQIGVQISVLRDVTTAAAARAAPEQPAPQVRRSKIFRD